MKKILHIICFMILGQSLWSQGISDALRFSVLNPQGTARSTGAGGAFGAMGGDFGVLSINPAGIAEYWKGEFNFTPSISSSNASAFLVDDSGNTTERVGSKFGIANLGFVITSNPVASNFYTSNFAIGFNRVADFNNQFEYSGSTIGSITERFVERANGNGIDDLDDFEAYPAYYVGAITDFDEDNFYTSDLADFSNARIDKRQLVDQSGSINEITFAWAGDFQNKLDIGISVGIPFISYEEVKTYVESDADDEFPVFSELKYTEFLSTSGAGINFKLGFIYKGIKHLRLGGAIHSPNWYGVTDDYNTSIEYAYNDGNFNKFSQSSPDGSFKYNFQSPWRAVGSLGTIYKIGDLVGFFDVDVEYLDYKNASFNLTANSSNPADAQFSQELNKEIDAELSTATSFRFGSEIGYKHVRFRLGLALNESPFVLDEGYRKSYSGGFGFREDDYYFDISYQRTNTEEGYIPYLVLDDDRSPLANVETTKSKIQFTIGMRF